MLEGLKLLLSNIRLYLYFIATVWCWETLTRQYLESCLAVKPHWVITSSYCKISAVNNIMVVYTRAVELFWFLCTYAEFLQEQCCVL